MKTKCSFPILRDTPSLNVVNMAENPKAERRTFIFRPPLFPAMIVSAVASPITKGRFSSMIMCFLKYAEKRTPIIPPTRANTNTLKRKLPGSDMRVSKSSGSRKYMAGIVKHIPAARIPPVDAAVCAIFIS